jgi:hypothetical protein
MMNDLLSSNLYDNNNFYKAFEKDLKHTQHSVLIESPFITPQRMANLLPILRELRQQGSLNILLQYDSCKIMRRCTPRS